jgi:hypothetical protein
MSGGSYNYVCYKIEEFAREIRYQEGPGEIHEYRKRFSDLVKDVAKVAKEIEWADSCDTSQEDCHKAIKEFFEKHSR